MIHLLNVNLIMITYPWSGCNIDQIRIGSIFYFFIHQIKVRGSYVDNMVKLPSDILCDDWKFIFCRNISSSSTILTNNDHKSSISISNSMSDDVILSSSIFDTLIECTTSYHKHLTRTILHKSQRVFHNFDHISISNSTSYI